MFMSVAILVYDLILESFSFGAPSTFLEIAMADRESSWDIFLCHASTETFDAPIPQSMLRDFREDFPSTKIVPFRDLGVSMCDSKNCSSTSSRTLGGAGSDMPQVVSLPEYLLEPPLRVCFTTSFRYSRHEPRWSATSAV